MATLLEVLQSKYSDEQIELMLRVQTPAPKEEN